MGSKEHIGRFQENFNIYSWIVYFSNTMNKIPYDAIALDLDGTLLNSQKIITEPVIAQLQRVSSMGVKIILASGRMAARVQPFAEILGLPASVIAYNGAQIVEKINNQWEQTFLRPLDANTREMVYEIACEQELFLNIYAGFKLYGYHPKENYAFSELYKNQTQSHYEAFFKDLKELPKENLEKLLIIETPLQRDVLYNELRPKLSKHCEVLKSNPEYLEFLSKGTSKRVALEKWLETHSIDKSRLLAFGDAENDLEMLELAGLGIAMANSTPGLLECVSEVSQWGCDQDGIAREIERIFS